MTASLYYCPRCEKRGPSPVHGAEGCPLPPPKGVKVNRPRRNLIRYDAHEGEHNGDPGAIADARHKRGLV